MRFAPYSCLQFFLLLCRKPQSASVLEVQNWKKRSGSRRNGRTIEQTNDEQNFLADKSPSKYREL